MTISVVMPTMNRRKDLEGCLDHLLAQTLLPDEMVVVDAGQDQVQDLLEERLGPSPISLVYATSEPGTSSQRNLGINLSSGDFLLFLDDDMWLEPDYIERSMACFEQEHDPPVGGVMGSLKNATDRSRGPLGFYCRLFGLTHSSSGDVSKLYPSGGVRWLSAPSSVVPIPVAATGRVIFRRDCFEGLRFSEFLPGYTHGEDVEVSYRIGKRWTILQTPDALVDHGFSAAGRITYGDRVGRMLYSQYYFFRTHRPRDPYHLGAFAWSSMGLSSLCIAEGVAKNSVRPALRGVLHGYQRCFSNWRSSRG